MTSGELRQKFLDFFSSKGHTIIPSASLIPENDPTVLFTTAGMHPLVPYLMGEDHPGGKRVADSQKCIRTTDIEDVGDNRHLTLFEMLGNWSFGGYFKKEAIAWSWEFLTGKEWLNLDPKRIFVTVFMGNDNSPIDREAIDTWKECFKSINMTAEICPFGAPISGNADYRIFPLPAKDNWWGPAGETGPCGPCSEMFYDVRPQEGNLKNTFEQEIDTFRVMEIWNDVFMEFNKVASGKFEKLKQQNVDTGMGLERTVTVLTGEQTVFETDAFTPIFAKLAELSNVKYGQDETTIKAMRIIADHIKASTFIMGDDKAVYPSITAQGYIVRRLIRRAIRYARQLNITEKPWIKELVGVIVEMYKDVYPELVRNNAFVLEQFVKEEQKFVKSLETGLKEFEKLKNKTSMNERKIDGVDAFNLYQTYGFPIEITKELAKEAEMIVDDEGFKKELSKHQDLSRTASVGMFKGGLADASEESRKLHTAAHLMLAALRKVLGDHVLQKGSNITAERLRFDFSHPDKMTEEQKNEVERIVNEAIKKDLPVKYEDTTLEDAKKQNAMGVFESKYGEKVKIYTIGNSSEIASKEICGGPHVEHTGELGKFIIQKEESSSAGVRRIKAILS